MASSSMEIDHLCRLRWRDHKSNIAATFHDLRRDSVFSDVTLLCQDNNNNKANNNNNNNFGSLIPIRAHRIVLSSASAFFNRILTDMEQQQQQQQQSPTMMIYLRGIKPKDLERVLDFIYDGVVSVEKRELESFMAVARDLGVKGLEEEQNQLFSLNELSDYPSSSALQDPLSTTTMSNLNQDDVVASGQEYDLVIGDVVTVKNEQVSEEAEEGIVVSEPSTAVPASSVSPSKSTSKSSSSSRSSRSSSSTSVMECTSETPKRVNPIYDISDDDEEEEETKGERGPGEQRSMEEENGSEGMEEGVSQGFVNVRRVIRCPPGNGGKCQDCGRFFKDIGNAMKHFDLFHTKEQTCPNCKKICKSLGVLKRHQRKDHGIFCWASKTKREKALAAKVDLLVARDGKDGVFRCKKCNKTNRRRHLIQKHVEAMHVAQPKVKCEMCGMRSKNRSALIVHKSKRHKTKGGGGGGNSQAGSQTSVTQGQASGGPQGPIPVDVPVPKGDNINPNKKYLFDSSSGDDDDDDDDGGNLSDPYALAQALYGCNKCDKKCKSKLELRGHVCIVRKMKTIQQL